MKNVELIYFRGCRHTSRARDRLLDAFKAAGLKPQWQEWERDDPASPAYARAYGSPTLLVNGRDVTGMEPSSSDASACRVYADASGTFDGAPSVDTIAAALGEPPAAAPVRAGSRHFLASLPAIGAAALPKLTCPACWPAYSGLLSSMGVSFVNYTPYLLPLTAAFLLISLFALGWRAHQRRGYRPLFVGFAGSVLLLVGKFEFESDAAMYFGMGILVAASLWNAWPRATKAAANCPACTSAAGRS